MNSSMNATPTTIQRTVRNSDCGASHGGVTIQTTHQRCIAGTSRLGSDRSWARWSAMMNSVSRCPHCDPVTSGVRGLRGRTVRIRIMFPTRPSDSLPDRERNTLRSSLLGTSRSPAPTDIHGPAAVRGVVMGYSRIRGFHDIGGDSTITSARPRRKATLCCDH